MELPEPVQRHASNEDGLTGFDWCAGNGAGGGGNSLYWGRPFYQRGPGVNNPFTQHANGSTECTLAATGTPCREDPDVSANADENTPYAEFCTGNSNTPFSVCGTFSGNQTPPGWFGIGGTSLSSPLWSGIAADRDSFQGHRSGNLNPLLYLLYNTAPGLFFHDITGAGRARNSQRILPDHEGIRRGDRNRSSEDECPHHPEPVTPHGRGGAGTGCPSPRLGAFTARWHRPRRGAG